MKNLPPKSGYSTFWRLIVRTALVFVFCGLCNTDAVATSSPTPYIVFEHIELHGNDPHALFDLPHGYTQKDIEIKYIAMLSVLSKLQDAVDNTRFLNARRSLAMAKIKLEMSQLERTICRQVETGQAPYFEDEIARYFCAGSKLTGWAVAIKLRINDSDGINLDGLSDAALQLLKATSVKVGPGHTVEPTITRSEAAIIISGIDELERVRILDILTQIIERDPLSNEASDRSWDILRNFQIEMTQRINDVPTHLPEDFECGQ
jgi:hypothetical protein